MTTTQLDQELERLFSAARVATAPDAGARERVRAGLSPRLAGDASAPRRARSPGAWLGAGFAVLGVCGLALWLTSTPRALDTSAPVASRIVASPSRAVPPPITATPTAPPVSEGNPAPSVSLNKPPVPARGADPAEELPLVKAMQQALRAADPSQALVLAAEHARRFPRGALVEEREGVRAVARCQLAAPDARAPILAAFTGRFATSPYAARVKAACQ